MAAPPAYPDPTDSAHGTAAPYFHWPEGSRIEPLHHQGEQNERDNQTVPRHLHAPQHQQHQQSSQFGTAAAEAAVPAYESPLCAPAVRGYTNNIFAVTHYATSPSSSTSTKNGAQGAMMPPASPFARPSSSMGVQALAHRDSPFAGGNVRTPTTDAALSSPSNAPEAGASNTGEAGGRKSKKRKLSISAPGRENGDAAAGDAEGGDSAGSPQSRKQRACDQCKQQKLKCNLVENPFTPCDRCRKFNHVCKITEDFKRVAKRTQVMDLERENAMLRQRLAEAEAQLHMMHTAYSSLQPPAASESGQSPAPMAVAFADHHGDAQLLLQLKQGQAAQVKKLGDFNLVPEVEAVTWNTFLEIYHKFLPILDDTHKDATDMFKRNHFLFWTIIIIALRHRNLELDEGPENPTYEQILPFYKQLLQKVMAEPPTDHLTVKAWCLLCYWPLPVSTSNKDLTMSISGLMMKHAMQLGLHRPSHPDDFSRNKLHLRQGDINDRLRTWIVCNLVAQNVSTGYGQPPDTVYDATLNKPYDAADLHWASLSTLHARLGIERIADQITRTIYSVQNHQHAAHKDPSIYPKVDQLAKSLMELERMIGISSGESLPGAVSINKMSDHSALDVLYYQAAHLHLRLHVFSSEPSANRYRTDLNDLYLAATTFLDSAFGCGFALRYAPNYIMQMMFAAAVALLKLLNSSFGNQVFDRSIGERLFWDAIGSIREMSVRTNDLTQRLSEVFAQMWKADAERYDSNNVFTEAENGEVITTDLKLKRRARMSMSHVYDSIWRWKEEMDGKIRAEKLEAAVKNPTSPMASTHRDSLSTSTGRRSADPFGEPPNGLFGAGQPLGLPGFDGYTEFDMFDPMNWAINDFENGPNGGLLFNA